MERGNCFSVQVEDGTNYRIVNFNEENLEELLKIKVIKFPIKISQLKKRIAQ